ncbi:MAG TPA: hypothetical protein VGC73_05070 [Pyrinomonadaceae bacterium]|jgi:hypothetical protein
MVGNVGLLILVSVGLLAAQPLDRIYRVVQDKQDVPEKSCKSCLTVAPQTTELPVEVFQVLDLPLSIHEAALVRSDRTVLLRLSLGNSSDLKIIGLRYSLVSIDSRNQVQPLVNRTEGFSLRAYGTKTLAFKTPIRFKQKDGERLLLMIEQVISRESIWEVVKAKDAFEAYARGDYSVAPTVLRVANQVDAPPGVRPIIYFRKN